MGYYIQTDGNRGKSNWIVENLDAIRVQKIPEWEELEPGLCLVTVINNGPFEAAHVSHDQAEYDYIVGSVWRDSRPREYLVMAKDEAFRLAGIKMKGGCMTTNENEV